MNGPRHKIKLYWLILWLKVVHIPIVLEGLSPTGTNGTHAETEEEAHEDMTNIKHSTGITTDRGEQAVTRSSYVDAESYVQSILFKL